MTGGGVSGGKPNPGSNITGISQPGNGGPGNIGQTIPPQNKDDKSWLLLCSALTDGPYSYI